MKKLSFVLITPLLAWALLASALQPAVAADRPSAARAKSGTSFVNADLTRVAKTWERTVGGTVVVSERAKAKKVSMEISAPTKEEWKQKFIDGLRENGVFVIERADGVVFDTEPAGR